MGSQSYDFIAQFAEIAVDRLARAGDALESLMVDRSEQRAALVDLGRELHSIKGEARLVGLNRIFRIAQLGEELLRHARTADHPGESWILLADGLALCCRLVDVLPNQPADPAVEQYEGVVTRFLAKRDPAGGRSAKQRIVIAEDSNLALGMFTSILENEGYEVYGARDGLEAMGLIMERRPHAVVTDIDMPRMNGFELIRAIRAGQGTKDLPVIIVTAQDSSADWEQGVALGVSGYLIKANFKAELLTEVVERTLSSRA